MERACADAAELLAHLALQRPLRAKVPRDLEQAVWLEASMALAVLPDHKVHNAVALTPPPILTLITLSPQRLAILFKDMLESDDPSATGVAARLCERLSVPSAASSLLLDDLVAPPGTTSALCDLMLMLVARARGRPQSAEAKLLTFHLSRLLSAYARASTADDADAVAAAGGTVGVTPHEATVLAVADAILTECAKEVDACLHSVPVADGGAGAGAGAGAAAGAGSTTATTTPLVELLLVPLSTALLAMSQQGGGTAAIAALQPRLDVAIRQLDRTLQVLAPGGYVTSHSDERKASGTIVIESAHPLSSTGVSQEWYVKEAQARRYRLTFDQRSRLRTQDSMLEVSRALLPENKSIESLNNSDWSQVRLLTGSGWQDVTCSGHNGSAVLRIKLKCKGTPADTMLPPAWGFRVNITVDTKVTCHAVFPLAALALSSVTRLVVSSGFAVSTDAPTGLDKAHKPWLQSRLLAGGLADGKQRAVTRRDGRVLQPFVSWDCLLYPHRCGWR